MSLSNWIELSYIVLVLLIGGLLKIRSRRKVAELEGAIGVNEESDCLGETVTQIDLKR